MRLFNLVFESQPGYILDFSKSSFENFFNEELNIDIDDARYREEETSKARHVRCLLEKGGRGPPPRVLNALWQHKTGSMPEQADQSLNDWLALISRLENTHAVTAKGDKPVPVCTGSRNECNESVGTASPGFPVRELAC